MHRRKVLQTTAATATTVWLPWTPQPNSETGSIQPPLPSAPMGLGVGAPWQVPLRLDHALAMLKPAWWYDWRFEQIGSPGYVPMIWGPGTWDRHNTVLRSLFARRPEQFWLLWNEPERSDQADMAPQLAADATRMIAQHGIEYAAPGVALTREGYLWLDDYLRHDGPVPDCWHVHIYHCTEPDQWDSAWTAWVDWMHHHGVVRPTIVSETNAWTDGVEGQQRMVGHVAQKMDDDPLLLAIAWFAHQWHDWINGEPNLLNDDGNLTSVGEAFEKWHSHNQH